VIGLFGTITFDFIKNEKGISFTSVGGVLYQAGVLAGLDIKARIYSNLGAELKDKVFEIINKWNSIDKKGIKIVPGKGNHVSLYYPVEGERIEILKSVVPPYDPEIILRDKNKLKGFIAVFNSGYDLTFEDWRKIVNGLDCPIGLDIHSLALEKKIGEKRKYRAFPEWIEWTKGVTYLQANRREIASMLGKPEKLPSEEKIIKIGEKALSLGIKAVFVTLGEEGILVLSSESVKKIIPHRVEKVIDTTGCGDVFASATMAKLIRGEEIYQAVKFGIELASRTVSLKGPQAVYELLKFENRHLTKI